MRRQEEVGETMDYVSTLPCSHYRGHVLGCLSAHSGFLLGVSPLIQSRVAPGGLLDNLLSPELIVQMLDIDRSPHLHTIV